MADSWYNNFQTLGVRMYCWLPEGSNAAKRGHSMSNLRLLPASNEAEHRFAQELTRQNMEQLTKSHWGEWRSDVLSVHYPCWINFLIPTRAPYNKLRLPLVAGLLHVGQGGRGV